MNLDYGQSSSNFPRRRKVLRVTAATVTVLTLAAIAGCSSVGSGSSTTSGANSSSTSASSNLARLVPASIRNSGVLVIGTNADYPPREYIDPSTNQLTGIDIDMGNAIAAALGLKAQWQNVAFDSIIAGLQAGRFNIGMSAFSDSPLREKAADFVTYMESRSNILVSASYTGPSLNGFADLCGLSVAIDAGDSYIPLIADQSKVCTTDGKKAIDIEQYANDTTAFAAVSDKRAQSAVADAAVSAYTVPRSSGTLKVAGSPFECVLNGIAVKKGQPGLVKAIQAAVNYLISDGQYQKILQKYGVVELAVQKSLVNDAAHYSTSNCSQT